MLIMVTIVNLGRSLLEYQSTFICTTQAVGGNFFSPSATNCNTECCSYISNFLIIHIPHMAISHCVQNVCHSWRTNSLCIYPPIKFVVLSTSLWSVMGGFLIVTITYQFASFIIVTPKIVDHSSMPDCKVLSIIVLLFQFGCVPKLASHVFTDYVHSPFIGPRSHVYTSFKYENVCTDSTWSPQAWNDETGIVDISTYILDNENIDNRSPWSSDVTINDLHTQKKITGSRTGHLYSMESQDKTEWNLVSSNDRQHFQNRT